MLDLARLACKEIPNNLELVGQLAFALTSGENVKKHIEGMEVVDSFLEVERVYDANGDKSVPVEPIVIEKAEIMQ